MILDKKRSFKKIMKKKRKQKFFPLSSQFGIPGVSYRIQLGTFNGKWTLILLKGRDVITSQTYEGSEFPNQNEIVAWILTSIVVPGINPHQVIKSIQVLVKQAMEKKEKESKISVSDLQNVKLEKVPESEIRRPKGVQGWVKGMKSLKCCSKCNSDLNWKYCPFCGNLLE